LRERGEDIKKGASSLLNTLYSGYPYGELRRGEASLIKYLPLPLIKGREIMREGHRIKPRGLI